MVQKRIESLETIRKFLTELKKEIPVEGVYLFGSHLSGKPDRDSDIDLAIVSEFFESMDPLARLVFLGKIAWRAGTPEIEAIGYTSEEFNQGRPWDFPAEVRRTGQPIS